MARNPKFPTFKPLVLSCGCRFEFGSRVNPASVNKCPSCEVKVTAIEEPAPVALVESPAPVIVTTDGAQLRLVLI